MRVLAFEDHYDIESILTAGGVKVGELVIKQNWNSNEALNHIQGFAPDVLLLDHYMPPETGLQVLESLLSSDVNRPHTIIAMSSERSRNEDMVLLGANLGVVKFKLADLEIWPK
jgi:chemotaxis response regulator CheB